MTALRTFAVDIRRQLHPDALIAALASRQHGVVARWQLLELGVRPAQIEHRVRTGHLHAIHRGVYAVGHPSLSVDGRSTAAALAGGPGAVLGLAAAAVVYGVVERSARYDVIAPRKVRRPGIRTHCIALPDDEMTTWRGIPVTTVPRTLLDLATVERPGRVRRAMNKADALRLTDALSLADLVERHPRHRGARVIRTILADADPNVTRSELEELFLDFLADRGFRRPRANVLVEVRGGSIEVDCAWEEEGVIAELDGRAYHGGFDSRERDTERDALLHAAGWVVIRVTWRRLHRDPDGLATDLAALLEDWPRRRR